MPVQAHTEFSIPTEDKHMPKGIHVTWETARKVLEDVGLKPHLIDELKPTRMNIKNREPVFVFNWVDVQSIILKYGKKPPKVDGYLTPFQRSRHAGRVI